MAGIYFHIPFCKTRCSYCDFFSSVSEACIPKIIKAEISEIKLKKEYLCNKPIKTIYFGGGTPSFLTVENIERLLNSVYRHFKVISLPEITIEVNPDDINLQKSKSYISLGINRVSIGIQSFYDDILSFLNRRHNTTQAINSIETLKRSGFTNISIDLIYGVPNLTQKKWEKTIEIATQLNVQHISAYHLSFEKGTKIYNQLNKKEIFALNEDESFEQYALLCKELHNNGYEHYEISNFSLPGYISIHNNNYWQGKKYAGIGPSAHSFNGHSRQWNVSDLKNYIAGVKSISNYFSKENLTKNQKYNEMLLTHLRTSNGIATKEISNNFGEPMLKYFLKSVQPFIVNGKIKLTNNHRYIISEVDWFISDGIIANLCKI